MAPSSQSAVASLSNLSKIPDSILELKVPQPTMLNRRSHSRAFAYISTNSSPTKRFSTWGRYFRLFPSPNFPLVWSIRSSWQTGISFNPSQVQFSYPQMSKTLAKPSASQRTQAIKRSSSSVSKCTTQVLCSSSRVRKLLTILYN